MEKVLGIGGVFWRARDPETLAKWYETHLGIAGPPSDYHSLPWQQQAGTTVFAPFKADTGYFAGPGQHFMLNFRVRDLEAMLAQLEAAGITVTRDPETYPNGRFARVHDPEGNAVELWQEEAPGP